MQALAAVVFERTPEGAAAVKSSSDTLPRALRSVLLAVDGHSSVARYEPFLTSLMPLDEKFAALEQLGLLRRAGSSTAGLVGLDRPALAPETAEVGAPDTAPAARKSDFESGLHALSRQMGVIPDNSARRAGQGASSGIGAEMASLVDLANNAAVPKPRPEPLALAGAAIRLEDLLAKMEAFLSQAIGLDGLPVAIMVAQISSIEQLRLELPSYSQLLRSYGLGAQTEAHINSLETQLALCS
jgi:hypothetical protein